MKTVVVYIKMKKNQNEKGVEPTWRLCFPHVFCLWFLSHGNSFSSTWNTQFHPLRAPQPTITTSLLRLERLWDGFFRMTQRVWNKCLFVNLILKKEIRGWIENLQQKNKTWLILIYIYIPCVFVVLMDHASGRYFFEAVSVSGNMQHNACVLWLLMEEIRRSPVELGCWDPNIDKVFIHPRWLFGISEPSTVVFLTGTKNIAPIGMTSNHLLI